MKISFIVNDEDYGLVEMNVMFDINIEKTDKYIEEVRPIIKSVVGIINDDEIIEEEDFYSKYNKIINEKISDEIVKADNLGFYFNA